MSYIDTIQHELVGYLNGLPIYHPLETVSGDSWGGANFSCSPANLIVGGGSGEHPALVIHHPESLVAAYFLHDIAQKELHFSDRYTPPPTHSLDRLYDIAYGDAPLLEFCGWSMRHTTHFVEAAQSSVHYSPLKKEQAAEEWIILSLGEFIHFSLSELNQLKDEIENLEGTEDPGYWLCNVTCPPPGYIKSKKMSLTGNAFRQHGFFRWDYVYPPGE